MDNLQQAELVEREACLRRALEALLADTENGQTPSEQTIQLLEAAGYEYTPATDTE